MVDESVEEKGGIDTEKEENKEIMKKLWRKYFFLKILSYFNFLWF